MYEISAYFINYLRIATSLHPTQTETAAMPTAPTGKKTKSSLINNTTVKKLSSNIASCNL